MRDVRTEFKDLRLHGMASAWSDLMAQGTTATESLKWLIEHLLQVETTDRAMRSVSHQMHAAKFPMHRDLAGLDFDANKAVDQSLIRQLATLSFTDTAQNAVCIGGPGRGKHIWPLPSRCWALPCKASECGSTRRSIWSMPWNGRSMTAKLGGLRYRCYV